MVASADDDEHCHFGSTCHGQVSCQLCGNLTFPMSYPQYLYKVGILKLSHFVAEEMDIGSS